MKWCRIRLLCWGVALGLLLIIGSVAAWSQVPPDREPDVVLLRDGKRIDCIVVSISNEVLYYNAIGREGLQQVELHKVMTIALGGPKVDLLAQARQQAEEARQAEEAKRKAEEELKKAEEAKIAAAKKAEEEAKRAEEARIAAEKRAEEEKKAQEEALKAEQAKQEDAAKQAEEAKMKANAEQTAPPVGHETGVGNAVVPSATAASDAWKNIVVTKNEADVKGMLFVDKYDITLTQNSNWSRAKSDEMELGATIQLQKRAVQRRATHLLIKEVEIKRTYGEPPAIHIVGEAYRKRN